MIPPSSPSGEIKLGGRYRLTSRIARGTLADFWRCEDEVLGRPVAAKILRPTLVSDPTIKRLFRKEAVAAARLSHANIVSVFDTGEHDGSPFIVMEYLGGGSLRDRIKQGPMPPETVAQIGADICAALGYAHKAGIIHGDVRPENVLFSEAGHLKVSDFALAKAAKANPRLTDPEGTQSASLYLAPEVGRGDAEPDARSDLFSVGVILYECLVGVTPAAAARKAAEASGERLRIPAPKELRPDVPDELDMTVIGALQRDPSARFQSARALEKTLRPLAPASPLPAAQRTGPRTRHAAPAPRRVQPPGPPAAPEAGASPAHRRAEPRPPRRRAHGDSFLRTEGRWLLPTILVVAAATALVLFIPSVRTGISNVVAPQQPQDESQPVELDRAQAFDPPPGDGQETPARLGQAVDGDPGTSWATSSYSRPAFGGLKDGVGIWFDLGSARELSGIRVTSVEGGWEGSIRYSDDGRRWSDTGDQQTVSADQTFDVSGSHRYWMVWISNLVRTPGEGNANNPYAVAIREIVPLSA